MREARLHLLVNVCMYRIAFYSCTARCWLSFKVKVPYIFTFPFALCSRLRHELPKPIVVPVTLYHIGWVMLLIDHTRVGLSLPLSPNSLKQSEERRGERSKRMGRTPGPAHSCVENEHHGAPRYLSRSKWAYASFCPIFCFRTHLPINTRFHKLQLLEPIGWSWGTEGFETSYPLFMIVSK